MPSRRVVRLRPSAAGSVQSDLLREQIRAIQQELEVDPEFPEPVLSAAEAAAAAPRLPELDRTDLELVTIDPSSSMDLDQAVHVARQGDGYLVSYAIADLAAFVAPGDAIDEEAHRRGETLYGADSKIPLHPPRISEDAGSLLPDQVRPALLWTITVDADGEGTDVHVERALVRSRAKLDYAGVQRELDAGTASTSLTLLREVGELRLRREATRGGLSLPLPEQEIVIDGDHWSLEFRELLPVEQWNAQISLLTGFAAAHLMLGARVGLLRTLPPADPRDVERLRRTARGLRLDWPAHLDAPEFIRGLDAGVPAQAAMIVASTRLLRGSGYAAFSGELPEQTQHAGLAAEYAHVTAPLRRLADRYAAEICVAICARREVPDWVLQRLPELPDTMRDSARRANQYENALYNLVEAGILHDRVGEEFEGVVVEVSDKDPLRGTVTMAEPAVEAPVSSTQPLPLGTEVTVRLVEADMAERRVQFEVTDGR